MSQVHAVVIRGPQIFWKCSNHLGSVSSPLCVCETRRRYVVKHNLITEVYLMNVMENNYMFRPVLAIIRLSKELKG